MFNTQQIKEIIPHRYPFLLVDCILEILKMLLLMKSALMVTFQNIQYCQVF